VVPDAAFGPMTPAKKIANVTGIVTTAASQAVPLTSVPTTIARLPATARPACATSLSARVPPKPAMTSVANPPNVANSAICGFAMPLSVSANSAGMTTVARTARIAAGTDQAGFHQGRAADTLKILRARCGPRLALTRCQQRLDGRLERCHPGGGSSARRREVLFNRFDDL
jgi:hypothetical protein